MGRHHKPFRFENFWLQKEELREKIPQWWEEGRPAYGRAMFKIHKQLQYLKTQLKYWRRANKTDFQAQRAPLVARWDEVQKQFREGVITDQLKAEDDALRSAVEDIDNQEETYWKQRARTTWLLEGDRNTKFFHRTACARRQMNKMEALQDENGHSFDTLPSMHSHARDYFSKLFKESVVQDVEAQNEVISAIPTIIYEDEN